MAAIVVSSSNKNIPVFFLQGLMELSHAQPPNFYRVSLRVPFTGIFTFLKIAVTGLGA